MTAPIALVLGIIIGIALGTLLTFRKCRYRTKRRYSEDQDASQSILPAYEVIVNGLSEPNPDHAKYEWSTIGRRTRLGGQPEWIQGVSIPICSQCNKGMAFVAQIDSLSMADKRQYPEVDPTTGKKLVQFMYGDAGMIYVFMCPECGEVDADGQSY